jgi:hypothetical protein
MLTQALRVPTQGLTASALNQPGAAPALGTGTPGVWSQTGPNLDAGIDTIPKKSKTGLVIALAAAGVLVLGGGAFAAVSVLGNLAASVAPMSVDGPATNARVAAAQAEAEKAQAEAAAKQAEAAAKQAEAEKAALEAKKQAEAKKPAPVAVAPRPATPRPAARDTSKSSSGVSGGRKIRTSL